MGGPKDEQSGNNSKSVLTIYEIRQYQDARYVSASEAAWRLFSFLMVEHEPSIERLEVHLEDHHIVYYKEGEHENAKPWVKRNRRNLLHTFVLTGSIQTLTTSTTLIFRSTCDWTRQGDCGSQELSTKFAMLHLLSTTFRRLGKV